MNDAEIKALDYAVNALIPDEDLKSLPIMTLAEYAEHFNVSEWMICKKFDMLQRS